MCVGTKPTGSFICASTVSGTWRMPNYICLPTPSFVPVPPSTQTGNKALLSLPSKIRHAHIHKRRPAKHRCDRCRSRGHSQSCRDLLHERGSCLPLYATTGTMAMASALWARRHRHMCRVGKTLRILQNQAGRVLTVILGSLRRSDASSLSGSLGWSG